MLIGLTDPMRDRSTLESYAEWLKRGGEDVDIVLLSCSLQNVRLLAHCDALVLSGGGDVHPESYGQAGAVDLCREVNEARDAFELKLVERARTHRLPILGICRGAQLLNVAFGGTLIPDIEKAGFRGHRVGNAVQRLHPVSVEKGSFLASVLGTVRGDANTFHHQSVDQPGLGLRASARAHDGVIECVELDRTDGQPFLLGVQWHPERLKDDNNPFSRALLEKFIAEARG